jgi:valyl-tRNA synthetase
MVLGTDGREMHKHLGNYVASLEVMSKYGADATRQWATAGGATGSDIPFRWPDVEYGWRFLIKLWNASRFVNDLIADFEMNDKSEYALQPLDKWILSKAERLTKKVTDALERCQFNIAIEETRNFAWHVFCDCYIEAVKDRLYKPEHYGEEKRKAAQYTLYTVLYRILQLLAPITPHVTEEIYQIMYADDKGSKSINLSVWPALDEKLIDEEIEKHGDLIVAVINEIRREKSEKHMPLNAPIRKLKTYAGSKDFAEIIAEGKEDICGTCKIEDFEVVSKKGDGREVANYGDVHFVMEC